MGFDADIFEMYLNGVVSAECAWISASPIQRNGTITETSATIYLKVPQILVASRKMELQLAGLQ